MKEEGWVGEGGGEVKDKLVCLVCVDMNGWGGGGPDKTMAGQVTATTLTTVFTIYLPQKK